MHRGSLTPGSQLMNLSMVPGWDRLRHGGLLLDPQRLREIGEYEPEPLHSFYERDLRRRVTRALGDTSPDPGSAPILVSFVLQYICGFNEENATWKRGRQIPREWTRTAITGEAIRPRQLWEGPRSALLPVFLDKERQVGIGRGRRATSQVLQWLRAGEEQLALVTNGRQWRLVFAGLDFDAWCEWDLDLWLEAGELSPQVSALRWLLQPKLWVPAARGETTPLLEAILDSRKGQAELSQLLGERVREAVEIIVRSHGEVLKEHCADVAPDEIYRAAVRVVMRLVVILFAEARELLPRDNPLYHRAYGLTGLLEELEKAAARGGERLRRSWSAWPRVLALFRLVHDGSYHPDLPVPAYGGELFARGGRDSPDGMARALSTLERTCFEVEVLSDLEVHRVLERLTRTRVRVRQGRASTWVAAPVDFSDLSSEYVGILYEGLLDFELRTGPDDDAVVFLSVGNHPALALSRLEKMDDRTLKNLFEKMKDTSDEGSEEEPAEDEAEGDDEESDFSDAANEDKVAPDEQDQDECYATKVRAEEWGRRAVRVAGLVRKPRGKITPERELAYEAAVSKKARQLSDRIVMPGEWYLARWGGTRKGSGSFYTRPGLAIPTVQRTLRPLAWDPHNNREGARDSTAPQTSWTPKRPEEILDLKVVDPACGSGTFPLAALRFLTDALFVSLHHHGRISEDGDRAMVALLTRVDPDTRHEERLHEELLPCRPDDPLFESRLRAVLRRHVVERCLYGVDLDPLAVELCRLSLWIETMDRSLPFSFLDHKVKCGNALIGAWFDEFRHYPVMAWKNREGGDKSHTNGTHFGKEERTKAIKAFVKDTLTPDLQRFLKGRTLFSSDDPQEMARSVHDEALSVLRRLHAMPVYESAERAKIYREELLETNAYRHLKCAMDLWCACWFWPSYALAVAPLPSRFSEPDLKTLEMARHISAKHRFFHWELEFPDVFSVSGAGFDAVLGNPPWETLQPSSKEFFSNIDPLYRTYGKQEALQHQTILFSDRKKEEEWLEYNAGFKAQSNFVKYAANAFGDPDLNEESRDRFVISRSRNANKEYHNCWRRARTETYGVAQNSHPFRHQGKGKAYTYKLFAEYGHALLRTQGRLGFILPSGLHSDDGTKALRQLFLEACNWEWLFGFENRNKVFPIDSRFKFNAVVVEKGGSTAAIRTAFMRRKLEDWENAEAHVAPYTLEQIERFSPRLKMILEVQSARDLEILEKIYSDSVLLGEEGVDGWGIKYAQGDFNMTSDSALFPPRPKWEEQGYRPDEYSRWLKGDWQPIEELWADLGVRPIDDGESPCAQPPYDRIPIPRADIPEGVILAREADAWIRESGIEGVALPLCEGQMIGQFDFSQKGWVRGKGRGAVWDPVPWERKEFKPQYLMAQSTCEGNVQEAVEGDVTYSLLWSPRLRRVSFMDVSSATNRRTMIAAVTPPFPSGHSVALLNVSRCSALALAAVLDSFAFDFVLRLRLSGLHASYYILEECPLPKRRDPLLATVDFLAAVASMALPHSLLSTRWLDAHTHASGWLGWKASWSLKHSERLRRRCVVDSVVAQLMGLDRSDLRWLLRDSDWPIGQVNGSDPKGFWRIDKEKDPELRQTVLTIVAYHALQDCINARDGDCEEGTMAFLSENDGEGWMLPETLRLADYGLGHDERAKKHQPVASRLGPRFFDWQLEQDTDESWRECRLHARNLLGEKGYEAFLRDVEAQARGESLPRPATIEEPARGEPQPSLFD